MTRIEAKTYACEAGVKGVPDLCPCMETKMYELGQLKDFKTYIENESKCGKSENPRQKVIRLLQKDAFRICDPAPPPLYSMACWDGSIIKYRNPCVTCPPHP